MRKKTFLERLEDSIILYVLAMNPCAMVMYTPDQLRELVSNEKVAA